MWKDEVHLRLGNDTRSFHPVHAQIRTTGPRVLHHKKGRGQTVVVDPWVDAQEAMCSYGLEILESPPASGGYEAVLVAVAHRQFARLAPNQWSDLLTKNGIFIDLKEIVPRELNPLGLEHPSKISKSFSLAVKHFDYLFSPRLLVLSPSTVVSSALKIIHK